MPTDLVLDEDDCLCECRTVWYLTMALLRDGESYSRGAVYIMMDYDLRKGNLDAFTSFARMGSSLPSTIVGGHYCYSDPNLTASVHGLQIMMPEYDRCRLRIHFGDREELDFKLQTYGIPAEALPYKPDGSLSTEYHLVLLEMLRSQEECAVTMGETPPPVPDCDQVVDDDEDVIYIPRRFDVLFGKSVLAREHTGTRRALHVIEMYYDEYERAAGKGAKMCIAAKIFSSECLCWFV